MRNMTQVFERMTRQYKYLEKSLDDEMKKVCVYYVYISNLPFLSRCKSVTIEYFFNQIQFFLPGDDVYEELHWYSTNSSYNSCVPNDNKWINIANLSITNPEWTSC